MDEYNYSMFNENHPEFNEIEFTEMMDRFRERDERLKKENPSVMSKTLESVTKNNTKVGANMNESQINGLTLIENVDVTTVQKTLTKISQFQNLVKTHLSQNHDYGIIPGTKKPTLLKPGAEKIIMLMGLTSEYELIERVQDYEKGFFAFTVKSILTKGNQKITEGFGHCNTKETKWIKADPYTMSNTCLKMAKKRAQIDATLTVASLSQIFTQDIEDMDLKGDSVSQSVAANSVATDNGSTITEGQGKRLFAIGKGNLPLIKTVMMKFGYTSSKDITKLDYENICKALEEEVQNAV